MKEPRGCKDCGKLCHRNVWYTVPPGWLRIVSPRDGSVLLLCPDCKAAAKGG